MLSSKLVARVFHQDAFREESTRITARAAALSTEYLRLFIREAVLRANQQRLLESQAEAEVSEGEIVDQFGDLEDGERGLGVYTQVPPTTEENDVLSTRHLAAVSGLLVMDF